MELRDIEIFLVLAEELHFGRTAARLHVSTARVSQSIKQQERLVGAALFERTSRAVRLTPLGEQLRDDLRPHYDGLGLGLERARLAAQGVTGILRVGLIPNFANDLNAVWDAFRAAHTACALHILSAPFLDPFAGLRRGTVDVLIAWLPVEEPDLTVGPVVCTEPRVLAVASTHVLAGSESVTLEVLGDGHGVATAQPHLPAYWEEAYIPATTPSGRPVEPRLQVTNFEEILMLVSTGQMIHPIGAHATRYFPRPDITYLPLTDAPDVRWALIWRSDTRNPLVADLARVVRRLGTIEVR
ncbi:MAG: LysR family transcriptional regulator [Hamadaea sp.]|nr:LysR family transcriptional regulator [Hamadaea sp.]